MSNAWDVVRPSLETLVKPFPLETYRLANAHRAEVAPHLLAALERTIDLPVDTVTGDDWLHIHAMYLLAQWRETAALAPLLRLCHRSEEDIEHLIGDDITEGLPRCLATLCGPDIAPLRALAEDAAITYWVRHAALDAWMIKVVQGDAPRAPLLDFLVALGEAEAARLRQPEAVFQSFEMIDAVVSAVLDLGAFEMLPQVRLWFAEKLCDEEICDLSHVERHAVETLEHKRAEMDRYGRGYIIDAAKELSGWHCFKSEAQQKMDEGVRREQMRRVMQLAPLAQVVRDAPKIGRNDPCPCGSGKKHKKCCGL